jgi:hypothetical protein
MAGLRRRLFAARTCSFRTASPTATAVPATNKAALAPGTIPLLRMSSFALWRGSSNDPEPCPGEI